MSDVVILGAGGHGKVVLDVLRLAGHTVAGFVDADPQLGEVAGVPVLGTAAALPKLRRSGVRRAVVAIGDNRVRRTYFEALLDAGLEPLTAVHPAAVVSPSATLGRGVVVGAAAVVAAEAVVGDNAIVNTAAVVEHECRVGDHAHVAPGALLAGRVHAGTGVFVGLGAKVLPCLSLGEGATIGAGSVVTRDVPAAATVYGVPARAAA